MRQPVAMAYSYRVIREYVDEAESGRVAERRQGEREL